MYKWNAKEYAENSSFQKSSAYDFIQKLTFNETDRILDIGCGDGKITLDLAKKVTSGYVIGLDLSSDMVKYAYSNFESVENISFINGNAQTLPFYNAFDVIFSNYALHWVPNHYQLLAGIYCALRPKGRVFVQMSAKGIGTPIFDATEQVISKPFWNKYFIGYVNPFQYYTLDEYRSILEGAEFAIKRLEIVLRQIVHKSREGITGMLRAAFHPTLERVPPNIRENFLMELIDVLVSKYPADNEGVICIPTIGLQYEACIKK